MYINITLAGVISTQYTNALYVISNVVLAVSGDYTSIKAIFIFFIKVNKSSHIVNVFIRVFPPCIG